MMSQRINLFGRLSIFSFLWCKILKNQNAPIFKYDKKYITASKYTLEELYNLQEMVLEQIKKNPTTYTYELKKIKNYEQKN